MVWRSLNGTRVDGSRLRLMSTMVWACAASMPVLAQSNGQARALNVTAAVSGDVSEVIERRALTGETHDTVTQLRPSIRLDSRSGRVVGSLEYSLNLAHHTQAAYQGQNAQNFLTANLQAEAIDRWMFVDASANITQQAASAYGEQSATTGSDNNANRIEVGTVRVSPYVRGSLASALTYEARLTGSATNGRRSKAADSSATGGSLALSSAVPGTMFGWDLSASSQTLDFRTGRKTQSDRTQARVSWFLDPDLIFSVRGGQESTDVADVVKTRYDNWGAGLTWRPSPRTRAQIDVDDRYFGRSHQVVLEHRLPSSSIRFASTRDAVNGADPGAAGQRVSLYQLLDRLLAPSITDATARDAQIRLILQNSGNADPNQLVSGGSINSAVTVTERNELNLGYSGLRMTGSLQVYSSKVQSLDPTATGAEPLRQWGYLGAANYQLSTTAQLTLTGSRLITKATVTQPGTDLKSLTLGWSNLLARRTTAGLNVRYSVFNSATDPYRQLAVLASLSHRF